MARRKKRGENMSGYFRQVFKEKPEWLEQTSNDVVLARYRSDHGMSAKADVGKSVKGTMANIKSVLRREARQAGQSLEAKTKPTSTPGWSPAGEAAGTTLESLEEMIDDCLAAAKSYDRAGLESVIRHLRDARNQVVWKMGKTV
jgi:hypothetical protein